MSKLNVGLIGTGFMGKAHAIALQAVGTVFHNIAHPGPGCLVDTELPRAQRLAAAWGFEDASDDWRQVCSSDAIDVIHICTPNFLHMDMALAAIEADKHVYCEKPLALSANQARRMCRAAEAAGISTAVGFNYICNPLVRAARRMIASGEIGEIHEFRGSYREDYFADSATPYGWRCARDQAGAGVLADLGSHLICMAEFLLGPIDSVFGSLTTVHKSRPDAVSGEAREVENEDIAQALVVFERGCPGTMDISRVATGKKCGLEFEVCGSGGSIAFDQERMNELRLYRTGSGSRQGAYRRILAGPQHPDYAAFCPAPGHGLGINDLKIIEVRNFLRSIETGEAIYSNFDTGCRVQEISDAIEISSRQKQWIGVSADVLKRQQPDRRSGVV